MFTADSIFNGRISVKQAAKGYRFSIDAVIVAHQVRPRPGDALVDLGTGCGIIPLILAFRHPQTRIQGIEIQPELADIARINVSENRMQSCIQIHRMDLRALDHHVLSSPVDIVTANPPFRKQRSGRVNPNRQSAVARHEILATLMDYTTAANRLLRTGGKFILVYAAGRLADLMCELRAAGIEPKGCRMVHSRKGEPARLVLLESVKGARPGVDVLPPLFIYNDDQTYCGEIEQMLAP